MLFLLVSTKMAHISEPFPLKLFQSITDLQAVQPRPD